MPLDVVVKVEGAKELRDHLSDGQDRQKALDKALHIAALVIQRRATELAPVRTGTLRRSIFTAELEPLVMAIGPGVNYGEFVELGTKYMKAQPYLFPALDQSMEQINTILADAAAHIVAKIGGKE